ncbi:MAG: undecaprenyldiphospho-muramoylpentapeptide beta-N-acetylglucosaminyltransferase [Clostridiales bacterium]|jgi:UDP-N-acetylglucosamine--N-acetylmuramyl-(pentapeptide) pyrophosphoryl-undecaprenol N-acetylglucosamine transferase|nr:undecaprenyldiphospho-muramoylpentapeptide beta-N-acetylglucosaminyltransferase [Eubacteriales bacterium]MDH7564936.1 undecaprenyldiphospho-muramoylpentapeptide beta-N-acetylglucosaminyltransferase [Clostridiales bacterium]
MKVVIAGGGTAGHINPGLAIAKFITQKNPRAQIIFVGTENGLETRLVPREGFELRLIKVRGFKRKLSFDTLRTVKELFRGMLEARRVLKEFKPDIVIGTGGYVCGPVLMNAAMMKIPTLIHEQNAFPGITNRILSKFVDAVAISFKESKKYFKTGEKLFLTGNPIRSEMLDMDRVSARQKLGIAQESNLVVIFGGSRGAEKMNETVCEMALKYYRESDCQILFATGEAQYDEVRNKLKGLNYSSFNVVPYIYNMAEAMASADLMVCRAGAITISELTALGIPSVIIPSPNVTANHQEYNARALEEQGAAVVILEKDLNGSILYQQITDLLKDREQLAKMARNAKKAGITNASEKIYSKMQELLKERKK